MYISKDLSITGIERLAEGPFLEGVVASDKGLLLCMNPYTPGTDEHEQWDTGWCEADDGCPR